MSERDPVTGREQPEDLMPRDEFGEQSWGHGLIHVYNVLRQALERIERLERKDD